MAKTQAKICVVGGCGHVGIPLGLAFASKNFDVTLLDVNAEAVRELNHGKLPFVEEHALPLLQKYLGKNLRASLQPSVVKACDVVVFVTGTSIDEYHQPRMQEVVEVIQSYSEYLSKDQLIILRSTVFPGSVEYVDQILTKILGATKLAFCPERIAQGKGIKEIFELPQIVSATSKLAEEEAAQLFSKLTTKIIRLQPKEAELAKLITNSWRYLEFAIANQFYMMVESQNLDFHKIQHALQSDYPRAQHFVRPGLTAGPCLFKDTMQLSAFHQNNFFIGQSAMLINEGLPDFLVKQMREKIGDLKNKKIAILGMTFKPNNEDTRGSLSFKIRKILEFSMAHVFCCDPYLPEMCDLKEALNQADGVILGVPHREYISLNIRQPYVDCWGTWWKSKDHVTKLELRVEVEAGVLV